ncbi:hypothetical protein M406DRAFT_265687 [Cryphonectria parasitica EP155]|uniref:Nuclear membrane fusion protein Kar5 n=1 Tax=Cryphonectria parasitica (strain ATCC 38755 / EP155) TaxID=660469 RepID=A0A9P4XUF7_CRYP1|nr:uncharacterized protein M406DRAFT_265687 [Cryphonectria parasitica EP155]KAF3761484.1 hypothetical protein M406DRAFT_265687 [Cryphonectria parasitica EP155]
MLQSASQPSDIYVAALSELQSLESQPLCHRVAARLLVGNCQLLDGKDEATILTDSGRQIRDFVDAYAASMAICDLERGRFNIPDTCVKFREPTLLHLPLGEKASLHVTSADIDSCLEGLGLENSAWSTWVSYRHKALMFCEAARADQEKTQNIVLFQKLTRIIAKFSYGVEVELQKHMDDLELRIRKANEGVQGLNPELDRLRDKLAKMEDYVTHDLDPSVRKSGELVNNGLQDSANLQQLITVMIRTLLDGNSHVAAAQEKSIELAEKNNNNTNAWIAIMATAAVTAANLNAQIELSRFEVGALHSQQQALSSNLDTLITITERLSVKYNDHLDTIDEAKNMTNEILETLEGVAGTAATIEKASKFQWWGGLDFSIWVPCTVSPVATLLFGSYGLEPSVMRNLALASLGEIIGISISSLYHFTVSWVALPFGDLVTNATVDTL